MSGTLNEYELECPSVLGGIFFCHLNPSKVKHLSVLVDPPLFF